MLYMVYQSVHLDLDGTGRRFTVCNSQRVKFSDLDCDRDIAPL